MDRNHHISYNPFFIVPFLLWVIVGGILLFNYSAQQLFFAINSRHTAIADFIMYYVTEMGEGFVITAVLVLLMVLPQFRTWWYFISASLCNLLPFFVQQSIKSYYDAPRPVNVFKHAEWIHLSKDWPELLYRSFPSGHSEGAFCFFCFLSLLMPPRHRALGLVLFMLAMAVCYSRVYLAAHFFADIYAGSIVGVVLCTFIYSVMAKLKDRFPGKYA